MEEENKIEETQEEVKETETSVEVKDEVKQEEKKKGSPVVGVILISVCLIVGIMCFYLGMMFANKEDKKEGTTTTTKETETTKKKEEVTTTKAVEVDNGHKNYDEPDKVSYYTTLQWGTENSKDTIDNYKYDEYELIVSNTYMEEIIESFTIGGKKIDISIFKETNFNYIHRFKNFILLYMSNDSCDSSVGFIYLFDYNGNMIFDSTKSLLSKANNNIQIDGVGGYSYDKENNQVYLNYYDDSFSSSFIDFKEGFVDQHEDDEDYEAVSKEECKTLKDDYLFEMRSKITFENGNINETLEKQVFARDSEVYDKVKDYCKNKYNVDIK